MFFSQYKQKTATVANLQAPDCELLFINILVRSKKTKYIDVSKIKPSCVLFYLDDYFEKWGTCVQVTTKSDDCLNIYLNL